MAKGTDWSWNLMPVKVCCHPLSKLSIAYRWCLGCQYENSWESSWLRWPKCYLDNLTLKTVAQFCNCTFPNIVSKQTHVTCTNKLNLAFHIQHADLCKFYNCSLRWFNNQGSQFVLVIKFQVISRFCPGSKSHSPGYIVDNFGTKRKSLDTKSIL